LGKAERPVMKVFLVLINPWRPNGIESIYGYMVYTLFLVDG